MSHTPTKKSRCDACGAAFNGCSLHATAPETAAECDRLREVNAELVASAVAVITMLVTAQEKRPLSGVEEIVMAKARAALARAKGAEENKTMPNIFSWRKGE